MRAFLHFLTRSASAVFGTGVVWLMTFLTFGQTFMISSALALLGGGVTYLTVREWQHFQILRKNDLSRKEYRYIRRNLKEAKPKINRLRRAFLRVRNVSQVKQNFNIYKTVRKIYANTLKEPKRFFQAERFYYKNLDSLVELAEKHAFLSSQPAKSKEMMTTLTETRQMISSLGHSVDKDLQVMLDDDMDTLHFELDVAKQSLKRIDKHDRRVF